MRNGRRLAGLPSLLLTVIVAGCALNAPPSPAPPSSAPPSSALPAPSQPTSSELLSFDLPERSGADHKLVFAHYFTPFPISLDNVDPGQDYYARHYLRSDGEGGKFARFGGFLRDRPVPRPPRSGDWVLDDFRTEIAQAQAVGIDGFSVDVLDLAGVHWERVNRLLQAASTAGDFTIMLMPDMTASAGRASYQDLARAMAGLAANPAAYRTAEGRVVIAPYKAEERPVSWWTDFLTEMRTQYDLDVALLPVFHDPAVNMPLFREISYGFSYWGVRNPQALAEEPNWAAQAHAMGRLWMAPIAVQDYRPTQAIFDEAANTSTLRTSWAQATQQDADLAQLVTWNDYGEGTSFAPSEAHGSAFLSLSAYYAAGFRSGHSPTIRRDAVYLTHRLQDYRLTPSSQQQMATLRSGTQPVNQVEVVTLLTAPAEVTVWVGESTYRYQAPAGPHVQTFPLAIGWVRTAVRRDDSLVVDACSPQSVNASAAVQDLQYHAAMGVAGHTPPCS